MENRFLFVLDTSTAMKPRTNGIARAVMGLLESDMRGEFRKGDTIGFWTYDERIHSDLPMLVWSKENKETVIADVMRYVRHQKYDGKAHLEKVLNTIGRVLQASERLTIVLIHDGSDPIHGTEFDSDINELQKKYSREFRSQHLPIVTVLAARGSIVYDYTINYPDSISVPHTAFPEPPPETNKPPVQAIVAAPTNAVPVVPAPRHIQIVMAGTNHLAHELSPAELAALTASAPVPAPASNAVSVTAQQSQPPPADSTTASTPAPISVTGDSQQANQASPEPVETKSGSTTTTTSPVVAQSSPAPISVTSPAPQVAVGAIASTATTTPLPASQPKSTEPVAHASAPVPVPNVAAIPAREVSPAALSNASAPETASITDGPVGRLAALSVIAISLLTIAVVLVIFLVRNMRAGTPSLISQSMDRGR